MAIIGFENIAPDLDTEEVPDGYRNLIWKNFFAVDDEFLEAIFADGIHSGEAAAYNEENPVGFRSPDHDDDFDLSSGFFAAYTASDLEIKVLGFDDGERVAKKVFLLDPSLESVTFGQKFNDIDEVKITSKGGTDPDPNDDLPLTDFFFVDDLFLHF